MSPPQHSSTSATSPKQPVNLSQEIYRLLCKAMAAEQRFVGIGDKKSSKVSAPPGGKSSIGFGEPEEASKPLLPKNSSSAAKARDLSTNFMAAEDPSKSVGGESKAGEDENRQNPQAPRPKGAPNRAMHPPGGASHGSFWLLSDESFKCVGAPDKNTWSSIFTQ